MAEATFAGAVMGAIVAVRRRRREKSGPPRAVRHDLSHRLPNILVKTNVLSGRGALSLIVSLAARALRKVRAGEGPIKRVGMAATSR
jgi:hypothetical protein